MQISPYPWVVKIIYNKSPTEEGGQGALVEDAELMKCRTPGEMTVGETRVVMTVGGARHRSSQDDSPRGKEESW